MAHVINHPCEGKDCRECNTCKFDEPIPVHEPPKPEATKVLPSSLCNYCGYLIKNYRDHGDIKFNACCGRSIIRTEDCTRPRTISYRIEEKTLIPIPDWCPKLMDTPNGGNAHITRAEEVKPQKTEYEIYQEKRSKLERLPNHLDWEDIKEGKIYVIPRIIKQVGKVVRAVCKTEYTLRCIALDDNLKETSFYHNVYRADLDANFIVEYHKF